MNRVRRDDPVNEDDAEVKQMLHRMHRQTGPRAGVHVLVMEIVDVLVERFPVNRPVDPVEMKLAPKRNRAEPKRAIHRVLAPTHIRHVPIRCRPHVPDFIRRPDRHSARAAPEDVVPQLVLEREIPIPRPQPPGVVLPLGSLRFERVEQQMPAPSHEPDQYQVPHRHLRDPIPLQRRAPLQPRLKIKPTHHRDQQPHRVPRPEEARVGEQPLEQILRARRPDKDRRVANGIIGTPFTLGVARPCVGCHAGETNRSPRRTEWKISQMRWTFFQRLGTLAPP